MRQTEREDQETDIRSLIFRTDLKKRGSRLAFLVSLNSQLSTLNFQLSTINYQLNRQRLESLPRVFLNIFLLVDSLGERNEHDVVVLNTDHDVTLTVE